MDERTEGEISNVIYTKYWKEQTLNALSRQCMQPEKSNNGNFSRKRRLRIGFNIFLDRN